MMASAASISSLRRIANAKRLALSGLRSAGPIVFGAILAALFTFCVTNYLNNRASLQQQELSALQDFVSTGADLDAAVTLLSDSALDGEDIAAAKREARQAVAAHAAASLGLIPVVGQSNVEAYLVGLGEMRQLVDNSGDVTAAVRASRGRMALIHNRLEMIRDARRRIYA
jgi:hypothetical protein